VQVVAFVHAAQFAEHAAHVLVTGDHVSSVHEKEQLPKYPLAQVPTSVLPLFVRVSTQWASVPAAHGPGAQVSVTCDHAPLVHEKEQAPV